jgi:predicted kinase
MALYNLNKESKNESNRSKNKEINLFIMVGIPGSGKSTWAEINFQNKEKIIALDEIRKRFYGSFPQDLEDGLELRVWNEAIKEAISSIENGNDTVIDSMALTKDFRKSIVMRVEEKTDINFNKIAIFLDTPLKIAIRRNFSRDKTVKEDTIVRLSNNLEEPTEEEGFKRVIRVKYNM